jgi:hypothetical protein
MRRVLPWLLALALLGVAPSAHGATAAQTALPAPAFGIAAAADGTAWAALRSGSALAHVDSLGRTLGTVALAGQPTGVAVAPDGGVWATLPSALVRVDPATGSVSTHAIGGTCPITAVAVDPAGLVYWSAPDDGTACSGQVGRLDGPTVSADAGALAVGGGLLVAPDLGGDVHRFALGTLADAGSVTGVPASYGVTVAEGRVWVASAGTVSSFPVDGTAVTEAVVPGLSNPIGLTGTGRGTVVVADNGHSVLYEVGATSTVATVDLPGVAPWRLARTTDGVLVTDPSRAAIVKVADAAPSFGTASATLKTPTSIAISVPLDTHGNATQVVLHYGPSSPNDYVAALGTAAGSAEGPTTVAGTLSDLDPGTTYHLLLSAQNARGQATTTQLTVATPPAAAQTSRAAYRPVTRRGRTTLRGLAVTGLSPGDTVSVTCRSRRLGCGFARKSYTASGTRVSLAKLFRRPLAPRARVTITTSREDTADRTLVIGVRRGKRPTLKLT